MNEQLYDLPADGSAPRRGRWFGHVLAHRLDGPARRAAAPRRRVGA